MTPGRLIAVVGPSGVGKDTVMRALVHARPDMHLVRRVITRPGDAGGEAFDSATVAGFEARAAAGEFLLHWQAHGLHYGIPRRVEQVLKTGGDAVVNLSRSVLAEAQARVSELVVINLTATPQVLAERLAARGREAPEDIARRLARADFALPQGIEAVTIDNGGSLEDTVARIVARLAPAKV